MLMMTDVDLCVKRPATSPLAIVEKVLMAIVEVDKGPIPATIPPITQVNMVYFCIYLFLLVLFMKFFMKMKELILVVMMEGMDLGFKIPSDLPFKIEEKLFMVMGKVDTGFRIAPLPPIMHVILVNHWDFLFTFIR